MSGGKLPEGWVDSSLGDVLDVNSGVGFPIKFQGKNSGDYPVYKVSDISLAVTKNNGNLSSAGHYISKEEAVELKGKIFRLGSTAFAKIGEAVKLNRRAIVQSPGLADNNVMVISAVLHEMDKFIFHFMNTIDLSEQARSTTVPSIRKGDIENIRLALPSIYEQKIIAEKLDTLLAQVDSTKARLEQIPQILKRFRQSILASAVNGNLTEEWRKKNSLNIDNWEKLTLGHIVKNIEAGKNLKCIETPPNDGQYGIIKISAVTWGEYDEDESKTLPDDSLFVESRRIATGDFLISRANTLELLGNPVIVKKVTKNLMLSDKVLRLVMADDDKPWVNIFLRSCYGRREIEFRSTGNQLSMRNIGQKALLEIPMPKPPAEEQHEIVRRVEQLFAYADTIEKKVNYALIRVKNLPQSILAKAFRGELSSQWRAEHPELITGKNSATALLKKIKDEREAIKILPKPKRSTIKKKTGERMSKQIIKVVEALTQAGEPLSGQQLLAAAGYPSDSSTDDLEKFFLDVRQSLIVDKSIVKLERKNDGQDWFSLAEMGSNE
ncbi:restriction endonuclease subunit S [Enterobacter asburiae]|uniref:restriction endonuclease subunit S n=1 Tax=Enterobacter asburiae TaxID=61645 RepID=UPI001F478017|nr:restriction endonuclease subunit S [Enterobacter asburiae]